MAALQRPPLPVPPHHLPAVLPLEQHRRAAAAIRAIGRLRHRASPVHFTCSSCQVTWIGGEANCWSCSMPASTEHEHRASALDLLLHAVHPSAAWRQTGP